MGGMGAMMGGGGGPLKGDLPNRMAVATRAKKSQVRRNRKPRK